MEATKPNRTEYMREYKKKRYNNIKDNPKIIKIIRLGYLMTLIEVQESKRRGMIDGENVQYPQPSYGNVPNMALLKITKIKPDETARN